MRSWRWRVGDEEQTVRSLKRGTVGEELKMSQGGGAPYSHTIKFDWSSSTSFNPWPQKSLKGQRLIICNNTNSRAGFCSVIMKRSLWHLKVTSFNLAPSAQWADSVKIPHTGRGGRGIDHWEAWNYSCDLRANERPWKKLYGEGTRYIWTYIWSGITRMDIPF